MSIFRKFEQLLHVIASPHKKVDLLSSLLSEYGSKLETYEGMHLEHVVRHKEHAQKLCQQAFDFLKVDDLEEANAHAESGILHLELAHQLAIMGVDETCDLQIDPETDEGRIGRLMDYVAKLKEVVEFSELTVSDTVHEELLRVIRLLFAGLGDLEKGHGADASRQASAGVVALQWAMYLIEIENDQSLRHLRLTYSRENQAEIRACFLAKKMAECRKTFIDLKHSIPADVEMHLIDAEEKFANCLDNIVLGDYEAVELDVRAALLDVEAAEQKTKKIILSSDFDYSDESESSIRTFKLDAWRIIRAAEQMQLFRLDSFKTRIQSAVNQFVSANKDCDLKKYDQAERLARYAQLDLDFCSHIVNSASEK
jgi:hypothetical protein